MTMQSIELNFHEIHGLCRTNRKARILVVYILLPISFFMWSLSSCSACWWKSKGQVYCVFPTQQWIFSIDTETPWVCGVREPSSPISSLARPQHPLLTLSWTDWQPCYVSAQGSTVLYIKTEKRIQSSVWHLHLGRRKNSLIRNKLRIGGNRNSIIGSATDLLWPWGSHWNLQFPLV